MKDHARGWTGRWTPVAVLAMLCLAVPSGEAGAEDTIRRGPAGSSMKAPEVMQEGDARKRKLQVQPKQPVQPGDTLQVQPAQPGRGGLANPTRPNPPGQPGGLTHGPLGGAGQPNLKIELIAGLSSPEGMPGTGMCADSPSGGPSTQVRFRVRNDGSGEAPASTTVVHWTGPNGFAWMSVVDTQPIQPGGGKNTYVNLPPGCWTLPAHGSCKFLVELDRNDDVAETEEDTDNHRSGECLKAGT